MGEQAPLARPAPALAPVQRHEAGDGAALAEAAPVRVLARTAERLNARPALAAQRALATALSARAPVQRAAAPPNRTGLPDRLKAGVEALSGIAMDDVRVHRNSSAPSQLQAHAFAQGSDIHLAPGQDHHLPHEAWHVVQQKQGRVKATMQLKGGVAVNGDPGLEREADAMGARAAAQTRSPAPPGAGAAHPAAQPAPPPRVVQRQLTANGNHYIDTRDNKPVQQQFRPAGAAPAAPGPVPPGPAPAGTYSDQHGFDYQYDPVTLQYRVPLYLPAVVYWDVAAPGQEFLRQTHPDHPIYRYTPHGHPGVAYRYFNHRYQRSPTARGQWVDALNQFVENPSAPTAAYPNPKARVLTADQTGVEKQYAIGKRGRDFVIPIKRLDASFEPGLPALHGGNIDAGETPLAAARRETDEESGHRLHLQHLGPLVHTTRHRANPANPGNRYRFNEATLTPGAAPPIAREEMAGEMSVTASHFVGHAANHAATKTELYRRFRQHVVGNPAFPGFAPPVAMPPGWAASHAMTALAMKIHQDVGQYVQGRDLARGGAAPGNLGLDHTHGHQMYLDGLAAARAGGAANADENAHGTGHADYAVGLAAARAGGAAPAHHAAAAAFADYQAGLAAARLGPAAPNPNHAAAAVAFADYQAGLAAARLGPAAPNPNHAAAAAAFADYQAGLAAAQAGGAGGQHAAGASAFQEFQAGRQDGQAGQPHANQNRAYLAGHAAGVVAAPMGPAAAPLTGAKRKRSPSP